MGRMLLLLAFCAAFVFLGITAMRDGMPAAKNERVYTILKKYIPYKLEKRAGGLTIVSKLSEAKEKPPAKDVYLRLEQLEQQWARDSLKLDKNFLFVLDKNKNEVSKILLSNDEKQWVLTYFKIK